MSLYMCIDMKCFYASCECVLRGLDPFKTALVVSDKSTFKSPIVLAISPYMKTLGVKNRTRLTDIPKEIKFICAKPQMSKYMKMSANIYSILRDFFNEEDIYVYSIDESFIKIDGYLSYYKTDAVQLANNVLAEVLKQTKLTASIGIGENMLLSKYALDILAKKSPSNIFYLTKEIFKERLQKHKPLTDFWQIGEKTMQKLHKMSIFCLEDIVNCDYNRLLNVFKKVMAEQLYNHAQGIDDTTIKDIKNYIPKSKSISHSQILPRDYNFIELQTVLKEMVDIIVIDLIKERYHCKGIGIFIRYSKIIDRSVGKSKKLFEYTNSYEVLSKEYIDMYNSFIEDLPIRQIGISVFHLYKNYQYQPNLFDYDKEHINKEEKLYNTIIDIKDRYGKNAVLRGCSYFKEGTAIKRNTLIGGHNAEIKNDKKQKINKKSDLGELE